MSTPSRKDPLTRQEVAHLARLARLAVTDEELDLFAGQLDAVLDAVARVGEAAVEDVPPTTHAVPHDQRLPPRRRLARACRATSSWPARPRPRTAAFRVPRILGEEA